jgi:hypothetical protein
LQKQTRRPDQRHVTMPSYAASSFSRSNCSSSSFLMRLISSFEKGVPFPSSDSLSLLLMVLLLLVLCVECPPASNHVNCRAEVVKIGAFPRKSSINMLLSAQKHQRRECDFAPYPENILGILPRKIRVSPPLLFLPNDVLNLSHPPRYDTQSVPAV